MIGHVQLEAVLWTVVFNSYSMPPEALLLQFRLCVGRMPMAMQGILHDLHRAWHVHDALLLAHAHTFVQFASSGDRNSFLYTGLLYLGPL